MKRIAIIISIFQIILLSSYGQSVYDGLLVSRDLPSGSARSLSMSGAFGALGGDASAAISNPGGLGVLRKSLFTVSTGLDYSISESNYLGKGTEDYDYKFLLDNISSFWVRNRGNKNGLVSLTYGLGYNKLQSYNQRILVGPTVSHSSLLDDYVDLLNDPNLSPRDFYEWLAFDSYLIDSLNGNYFNNFADSKLGVYQEKNIVRSGYKGEYYASIAGNISNVFFIGGTVGIQRMDYSEVASHYEEGATPVENFKMSERYDLEGTGVNLKLGMIARPADFIRLGASVQFPTVMKLESYFSTSLNGYLIDNAGGYSFSESSPDAKVIYQTVTPLKSSFSVGFVIGKLGLIDIDYERVDYSKIKLRSNEDSYSDINSFIQEDLGITNNLRVGGEYNLGPIVLRAGYAFYADPMHELNPNSVKNINVISGGIGYRAKDFYIDFGASHRGFDEKHTLFWDPTTKSDQVATIQSKNVKILTTIGFKF